MTSKPDVVVAGGGLAALELVLALRELAGGRVTITVIAPEREFVPRPLLVVEPLTDAVAHRRPLHEIADEAGFRLVRDAVVEVEPARRRVVLRSGATVTYDTLVLAPGATRLPAFDDAIHIGAEGALDPLRAEIDAGTVASVAFVAPTLTGWLLPLYEAALLTAALGARVTLVTPEERPMEVFGEAASARVAAALAEAGVEFAHHQVEADRVVALPLVRGPRIAGVPTTEPYGLIPVDDYGRITGLRGAYAIGDATDFPIKQGGLACQQAAAAATHIAAAHGADVTPEPFRPVLRATLLTGRGAPIALGAARPEGKLPGRYLTGLVSGAAATG
jgi:sulfide:quinone oxidoreductase